MKRIIDFLIPVLLIFCLIPSCETEDQKQITPLARLIAHTDCKNGLKSTRETYGIPDTLSCIQYSYNESDHKLTIKHINAGFNCCPDSLFCKVSLNNDTLVISEFEAKAMCHCNCLYDLDLELSRVEAGKYVIQLIEPYAGDQDELIFGIDLSEEKEGTFCVTRTLYPWGVIPR